MAQPAFVSTVHTAHNVTFGRYPSAQLDLGTGSNRVLVVFVYTDQADVNINITSCSAGCTSTGSQAGGTAMTAAAAACTTNTGTRQQGRLFYLAGGSLPTGTGWIVGDVTYTDRKPGITAWLYDDAGGGPITVSAGVNNESAGTSQSWTHGGTLAADELMFLRGLGFNGSTPTSPATLRNNLGFERTSGARTIELTQSPTDTFTGTSVILTGAASGDTTAPVLTSPTGVKTGTTTATVGATTDEANGTMYAVVTTSATTPSVAQIKAAQDHTGAAAPYGGNQAISTTGAKTFSATGLTTGTGYYAHVVHTDAAANDSNRVTSALFTTDAATLTITSQPLRNGAETLLASTNVSKIAAVKLSDMSVVKTWADQSTDGSGVLALADVALTAVPHLLVTSSADGSAAGVKVYTPA